MLDNLIEQMKSKGLIAIAPLKFRGKARPVLTFLGLMVDTKLYQPDDREWIYIIDRIDREGGSRHKATIKE